MLDPGFGSGGRVTTDFGKTVPSYNIVRAVQSDGKIVVGGYSAHSGPGGNDFAVLRYNTDGSLDTSFGAGGHVLVGIGSTDAFGCGVAVQADGKIVLGGPSYQRQAGTGWDFVVTSLNPGGTGPFTLRVQQ